MSTTDITLTTQEKKELEKRGFLVKKNFTLWNLIQKIWSIVIYLSVSIIMASFPLILISFPFMLLGEKFSSEIIPYIGYTLGITLGCIIFLLPILNLIYSYMRTGVSFIGKGGVIRFGEILPINSSGKSKYLFFIDSIAQRIIGSGIGGVGGVMVGLGLTSVPFLLSSFKDLSLTYNLASDMPKIIGAIGLACLYMLVPLIGFGLFMMLLRSIFQKFSPLYAFGNLGEKIQKLTPQISEKSQEIQKNFASDMNYRVLSDRFDGLASTFSQIVSLVIRLERVEARANKGNLFDSEKYIGSLRSDIVGPLRSLRSFLDTRRTELTVSQQELSRVRVQVGGASENRDLASARTEPLMRELTENIDRLDVMIEKMG